MWTLCVSLRLVLAPNHTVAELFCCEVGCCGRVLTGTLSSPNEDNPGDLLQSYLLRGEQSPVSGSAFPTRHHLIRTSVGKERLLACLPSHLSLTPLHFGGILANRQPDEPYLHLPSDHQIALMCNALPLCRVTKEHRDDSGPVRI